MIPLIDIHAHIWLDQEEENVRSMIRAAGEYGIEKIIISPLGTHQPSREEIRLLNHRAREICEREPLFSRYVTVAPEHGDALSVLDEGLRTGAVGMKLWVSCLCDDPRCEALYERCAQGAVPVLVHTFSKTVDQLPGESTAVHLRRTALRHPGTTFIMAHLGGNCYHGIPLIRDLKDIYTDFSGSGSRRDDLPYTLAHLGAERILFGTDMPGSFAMSWGQVLSAGPTEAETALICRENALRLFPALRKKT